MSRREQVWAGIGIAVMVGASFAPWASGSDPGGDPISFGGLKEGSIVVLAIALLAAVSVYRAHRVATFVCGVAAGVWMIYTVYTLPNELQNEAFVDADVAWGADLTFLGALVVVLAAGLAWIVPLLRRSDSKAT